MLVFRISKKIYCEDLSGIGAGLYGGRWNPKGMNMVYSSSSIALATLEYLVHNYHILSTAEICLSKIEIAEPASIINHDVRDLPEGWNLQLSGQIATQNIGKAFGHSQEHYILKVPSAITPGEFNLLLNPMHPHHAKTKVIDIIDPFVFDQRLLNFAKP